MQTTTAARCGLHWHCGARPAGQLALIEYTVPSHVTLQLRFALADDAEVATNAAAPKATASGGGRKSTDCE